MSLPASLVNSIRLNRKGTTSNGTKIRMSLLHAYYGDNWGLTDRMRIPFHILARVPILSLFPALCQGLPWPYTDPNEVARISQSALSAVVGTSRTGGQWLHIPQGRCPLHGEPHGRTGAQVVDLVFTQTERVETIDGSRDKAEAEPRPCVDTRVVAFA
jgi:hypothetical protein